MKFSIYYNYIIGEMRNAAMGVEKSRFEICFLWRSSRETHAFRIDSIFQNTAGLARSGHRIISIVPVWAIRISNSRRMEYQIINLISRHDFFKTCLFEIRDFFTSSNTPSCRCHSAAKATVELERQF